MIDVVALGESLIDFSPCGKNSQGLNIFEENPGGAPANVLAAVTKMGGSAAFIGKVGDDAFGHFLSETMAKSGIDCRGLVYAKDAPTTLAFVHLDDKGERSFSFYRSNTADIMLCWDEVDKALLEVCRFFHFGSLSLVSEPCKSATLKALDKARESGAIISYDPNYRPLLWESETKAVAAMMEPMKSVDLLKVNEEELYLLTSEGSHEDRAGELLSRGPSLVVVTMGEKGSAFFTKELGSKVETITVDVVDTTGAGDAFWGTVLAQLCRYSLDEIRDLSEEKLMKIIGFANVVGSLSTTKMGAIPAIPDRLTAEKVFKAR